MALFTGLLILSGILWAVDPEGMAETRDRQEQERAEREAAEAEEEAEAERAAEEARAEEEDFQEPEEPEEEPEPAPEPEPEPEPEPATFEEKLDEIEELDSLDDGSVYFDETTNNIYVDDVREPGLTTGTMCNRARDATIKVLEYTRDNIDEDYGELWVSFSAYGEQDATGDAPILGMATLVYSAETVAAIDSDAISLINVWETRDEGSIATQCQ